MPQREIDTKARGVHSHMRRLHSDPLLIRRPRTLGDQGSRPAAVAIKLISQPATGVEAIAVEAGRNLTLHQGLKHWTGIQRTGSSTHALVEQVCSRSNMQHHVRQRGGGWSR